jgi:hypothetical protein
MPYARRLKLNLDIKIENEHVYVRERSRMNRRYKEETIAPDQSCLKRKESRLKNARRHMNN